MSRICIIILIAVCALWTFGETLSCDQCGQECAGICGTRQFRACCFNNMKKRNSDFIFKFEMRPRRYAIPFYRPAYDD
ncbi:hypothetical protein HZH66_008039 [Vespula vulgaris]|uniref:Uncharacterized protein n=1 Tax=Vespula vulgaris TaxID=7454 RepID=A0A834N3W9_VESVU|nr:hypothetical protein HZH66_008039 [Vespula vulgaris]